MDLKTKIEDWWDNIVYYVTHLKENLGELLAGIRRWLSYYKILSKVYDFDYSSILEVERYQIIRVRDAIIKYNNHLGWERDVKQMNLAIKLLDIIEEDGCSKKVGNDPEFKLREDGLYEIVDNPKSYWTIPVYVNTKNYKRFWKEFDSDRFKDFKTGNLWKDHLRIEKAWYLYHKVRFNYLRGWWD